MNRGEPYRYTVQAAQHPLPGAGYIDSYTIFRRPNTFGPAPTPSRPANVVSTELAGRLNAAQRTELVDVLIKFGRLPRFVLPHLDEPSTASPSERQRQLAYRSNTVSQRKADFAGEASSVVNLITSSDGSIVRELPEIGWLHAEVPAGLVATLIGRNEVYRLDTPAARYRNFQDGWYLGDARAPSSVNQRELLDAGLYAIAPNPERHNFGNLTLAMIENFFLEDEACAWEGGLGLYEGSCADRIRDRLRLGFDCRDPSGCVPVDSGQFTEDQEDWTGNLSPGQRHHGTRTSSAAVADYMVGQADYHFMGDGSYSHPHHSAEWERRGSGFGPGAYFLFYGGVYGYEENDQRTNVANAIADAAARQVDAINMSFGTEDARCDPYRGSVDDDALEYAAENGVFVTAAAGNFNGIYQQSCNVANPQAKFNAFVVSGLDTSGEFFPLQEDIESCVDEFSPGFPKCQDFQDVPYPGYQQTSVDPAASARGDWAGSVSMIDLIAPARIRGLTDASGEYGHAEMGSHDSTLWGRKGNSFSSPMVAGVALMLKEWFLDTGREWINDPWTLHAVMLAMGDGYMHESSLGMAGTSEPEYPEWVPVRTNTGADRYSGLGRAKMKDLSWNGPNAPVGFTAFGMTVTDDSYHYPFLIGGWAYEPMPSDVEMLKCAMHEAKDTREGAALAENLVLHVIIAESEEGLCPPTPEDVVLKVSDTTPVEYKHRVTIYQEPHFFEGRCAYHQVETTSYESDVAMDVETFCYYGSTHDAEPTYP